jgi:chromosome partitioning protein
MKTIAVSLQKGGVGKTSLAVSLAAELASLSGSTLLVDADPQGSATGWVGPDVVDLELADVLSDRAALEKAVYKTDAPGLFLLPTAGLGGDLKAFAESQAKDDPFCMRRMVKQAAAQGYAYTVIDLSPGWGAIERAAVLAADEVLTPVLGDSFALDGLQIFADNLKTLRRRMETDRPIYNKVIVNAIDGRIKQHGEILASIKGGASADLKIYEVPVDPAFRMAQRKHLTLQALTVVKADTKAALNAITADIK